MEARIPPAQRRHCVLNTSRYCRHQYRSKRRNAIAKGIVIQGGPRKKKLQKVVLAVLKEQLCVCVCVCVCEATSTDS